MASLKADLATQTRMKTAIRLLEHHQRPLRQYLQAALEAQHAGTCQN